MIGCGIDAGSRTMKVVLMDASGGRVLASVHAGQRPDQPALARELVGLALGSAGAGLEDLARTVATGYGRRLVDGADNIVTEITCQAQGVRSLVPGVRSIVDIGGQDSKVISLDERGVRDFALNDRCAAGTGQFLEMASARLGIPLADLGRAAEGSRSASEITSMCAVFAETEIVSLLAGGAAPEDVAAGILRSIAQRVASLGGRGLEEPVVFTGGAALIGGLDGILASALAKPVMVAPDPLFTAARGAAILACETNGA